MADSKIDVRAATEWAWLNYDLCIIRDAKKIKRSIDISLATTPPPLGGRQMMDMAFSDPVRFNNHCLKVLGIDVEDDAEDISAERKSLKELTATAKRFEDAGKPPKKPVPPKKVIGPPVFVE